MATKIALLGVLVAGASAQMSLSTAVDLALRNDPRVKMAQADVDRAKAGLSQARDAYVPNVDMKGGYGTSSGPPTSTVPVVFSLSSSSLVFNFSQRDNLRAAEAGLRAAELAMQDVRDKVVEDTAVTYLDLDNAQKRKAALLDEYGHATLLVTIVQERIDAGQDTRLTLLKDRRTADAIDLDRIHTESEIAGLEDHLSRLIGLPGTTVTTDAASVPAFPALEELSASDGNGYGVRSAFANARSKQETAFGEARYKFRPQLAFGANYSRISTSHTSYADFYPGFAGKHSDNALSIGIELDIPLFDRLHEDHARAAMAEAHHAFAEAQNAKNQSLEGRAKLRHSLDELTAQKHLAEDDRDIAQEQLSATLVQLQPESGSTGGPQLSPEDEQSAHIQVSSKEIDLLDKQFQLDQAQVNLLRQTGQLDSWLKVAVIVPALPASPATAVTKP